MSIILDALRRADESREGRGPSTPSVRVPRSRRVPRSLWLPIASILIALNLIVFAAWNLGDAPASTPPTPIGEVVTSVANPPPTGSATSAPPTTTPPTSTPQAASGAAVDESPRNVPIDTATGAPLLGELPLSFRQTLPLHGLDVHVYAEDPTLRFVMINGQRIGEGDTSREGLEVVEIRPDGVILRWDGQAFFQSR